MAIFYITKEDIIRINKNLTSIYGHPHVVQQEANLDHVLEMMQHYGEGIKDEEQKILKKAAYLLYHLAYSAHIFSDGNKRTALTSTLYFLLPNGYILPDDMSFPEKQDKIARVMKETAEGKHSVSFICRWLKSIVKKKI